MHLSLCDWNNCRCKAVCPPENSNRYLLSPVSNHPYDPSLQTAWGIFCLSHFPPVLVPLLLPPCLSSFSFFFPIYLMSQTCFLFMTVHDWGAMLWCQLCSRGERSRDMGKQKPSPSKRGSTDIGGDECERLSVCSHAALSLGVDNLSQQRWGEKQADMSEQRCAMGEEGYWGLLIYTQWQDHRASGFTVLPVIAVQLWEIWKCSSC